MLLVHCYSSIDQSDNDIQKTVSAADAVLRTHFGESFSLYYEPLTSSAATALAADRLYIMIASSGHPLEDSMKETITQELLRAIPLPQTIFFNCYPLEAVAESGRYLADSQ